MEKYLLSIDNWQLYIAIENGNILYEQKSSNVIEQVFNWLKVNSIKKSLIINIYFIGK